MTEEVKKTFNPGNIHKPNGKQIPAPKDTSRDKPVKKDK